MNVENDSNKTDLAYISHFLKFPLAVKCPWNGKCVASDIVKKIQDLTDFANEFHIYDMDKNNSSQVRVAKVQMIDFFIKSMSSESKVQNGKDKSGGVQRAVDVIQRDYMRELKTVRHGLEPVERIITPDMLLSLHRELLYYDTLRRGELRYLPSEHEAAVNCPVTAKRHYYPSPEGVATRLQQFCDVANRLQQAMLQELRQHRFTFDTMQLNLQFATWAFYILISLHPFR